jgi:hypothetical protein
VSHDDDATRAAAQDILAALYGCDAGPVGHGQIRLGGTVVAAAPDCALEAAQHEILAALFGAPTPGGI